MAWNVFIHEFNSLKKSTLTWTISLTLLTILFFAMFPAFTKDVATTKKLLETLPPNLRQALNIDLDIFFSILGYFAYIFLYIVLTGSIQAMNLGTSIISKEARDKTADFLLTKPITRAQIITSKILAAAVSLIITNIVFVLTAVAMSKAVSKAPFNMQTFVLITSLLFLIQLFFLTIGLLVSVIIPKIKSVISVSLPIVFTFFIISMLDSVIGADKVRYVTPFKFYSIEHIIQTSSLEAKFLVIELIFLALTISATYIVYNRKDIHSGL